MNKIFPLTISILILLYSCADRHRQLVNAADYDPFLKADLTMQEVKKVTADISFWQKRLQRDTGNFVDMLELASLRLRLFKLSGNVADLLAGDSLLKRSDAKLKSTDPGILHALSQVSITQHRFRDAAVYNSSSVKAGSDVYTSSLLDFDAGMELGKYSDAMQQLDRLTDKQSFDYLIRKAKWEDHRGNLDGAITLMEQAFEKVKDKSKSLYCWALSNLGDMYGHAGKIEKAYNAYLDVLKKDSSSLYALKGIAWIAYSYDKNIAEAKRILHFILSQTKMPDLYLTLAEMEEFEGNREEQMKYIHLFMAEVEKPEYGDMYNKYLIHLYTGEAKNYDKALALAKKEINNRPTPETYDWLAWVFYNKGETSKAYDISKAYVQGQNFEPDAVVHTAMIYAANGKKGEAKEMLEECLSSSFEMGPVKVKYIREQLSLL